MSAFDGSRPAVHRELRLKSIEALGLPFTRQFAVVLHQFLHKNNLWWHVCNPKHCHNLNIIVERATISNDGATIMKLLDIVHPAAKTLVDIAKSQDAEVYCFN